MKKLFFLLAIFLISLSGTYSQNKTSSIEIDRIRLNGDALMSESIFPRDILHRKNSDAIVSLFNETFNFKSLNYTVVFRPVGGTTIYDLASNGTPKWIHQDVAYPYNIHVVFMSAPWNDISFANRKTKYYYSTNYGTNWSFIADVPTIRSGYPSVSAFSDGRALIANHNISSGITKTMVYWDAAPGIGSFTECSTANIDYIWPKIVATPSVLFSSKAVFIAAPNMRDSAFRNVMYQGCNWGGYVNYYSDQAEAYSIASGSGGKIGIAYLVDEVRFPTATGNVQFIESTDYGVTFSAPLTIFQWNASTDSLGLLRGVNIVYQGTAPKVVFETIKVAPEGRFYPNAPAKIRFWSPTLPGIDPNKSIVIANNFPGGNVWLPQDSLFDNKDGFGSMCRPVIGSSLNNIALFVAFMSVSNKYMVFSTDTVNYRSVYFLASTNSGINWTNPEQITPDVPLKDWTYPSISPSNDYNSNFYFANIVLLSDDVPGTFVNYSYHNQSLAQQIFARVTVPRAPGSVPQVPTLISPVNGAVNVPVPITFTWSDTGTVDFYKIQVSLSPTFTVLIWDSTVVPTTVTKNLPGNTTLYWHVSANNGYGSSGWSNTFYFTSALPIPNAPTLLSPANGSTVPLNPTLDWTDVINTDTYRVQVSQSSSFGTTVVNQVTANSYYTIPNGILSPFTVYYWRVNATNASGTSTWSLVWTFITSNVVVNIKLISSEIPTEYKLYNNYPNPFNSMTNIKFQMLNYTNVTLKVYDILGREVGILVNEKLAPGGYEVNWDASKCSSGIYIIDMNTGDFRKTKRMILIK